MNELTALDKAAKDINSLARELLHDAQSSLTKALELGSRCEKVQLMLKHGEWGPWVESNLEMSMTSVRNYMKCWRARAAIRAAKINDLKDAYTLLSNPPTPPEEIPKSTNIAKDSEQMRNHLRFSQEPCQPVIDIGPPPLKVDTSHYVRSTAKPPHESPPSEPEERPHITQPTRESGKPVHALAIWDELEGLYGKALNRLDELNKVCRNPVAHTHMLMVTKGLMGDLEAWRKGA